MNAKCGNLLAGFQLCGQPATMSFRRYHAGARKAGWRNVCTACFERINGKRQPADHLEVRLLAS